MFADELNNFSSGKGSHSLIDIRWPLVELYYLIGTRDMSVCS